jgi:hypothetical protein
MQEVAEAQEEEEEEEEAGLRSPDLLDPQEAAEEAGCCSPHSEDLPTDNIVDKANATPTTTVFLTASDDADSNDTSSGPSAEIQALAQSVSSDSVMEALRAIDRQTTPQTGIKDTLPSKDPTSQQTLRLGRNSLVTRLPILPLPISYHLAYALSLYLVARSCCRPPRANYPALKEMSHQPKMI